MKILLYHQHLTKSANLIEGRLLLLDSDMPTLANTYIATSGLPNNQRYESLWLPGRGSIPPNNLTGIKHYTVCTTPLLLPKTPGVEGEFYKISPYTVKVNAEVERGDFGIHRDANVPGSSGCVVLRTQIGWDEFQRDMKKLCRDGVNEIPLLVSYSR